ncbi:MAG: hypothetical protein E6Q77_00260 [Rhizobium sp.]|nr:MAG: hypothetical protein E6Q77_00260 [Rhizobium sp.]
MVDKVAATSAISPATPAHVNHSTSIDSEPDRALVAKRQTLITAGFERLKEARATARQVGGHQSASCDPDRASDRHTNDPAAHIHPQEGNTEEERLSGESVRIGTGNLDETVPFGKHIGFV